MRIVAGIHRGRTLRAPAGHAIRPTLDRVREAVFNVLAHGIAWDGITWDGIGGARVLDLFAGAGALGLESLSRGAAHAVFVDRCDGALAAIRGNAAALGEGERVTVIKADATRLGIASAGERGFTLAFLDPPYGQGLVAPTLRALAAGGWLAQGAIVVVETGAAEALAAPAAFAILDVRTWGPARVSFLRCADPGHDEGTG